MLQLRDYQIEASDFLFSHDYALMLAPVGAGKTATAIDAMRGMLGDNHVRRWLVVAPHRVCLEVWPQELQLWAPGLTYAVAVGGPKARAAAVAADTDILITNYESLPWLAEQYPEMGRCDGILYDELTRVKNQGGKRAKALAGQLDLMRVRWGLTASFTSEGLEDVHGQCKAIHPRILGRSKGAFLQRFFIPIDPRRGQWAPRADSYRSVMDAVRPYAYVLDPGEYTTSLPPIHYVEVPVAFDSHEYREMRRTLSVQVSHDKIITAANGGVAFQKLHQLASGFVYESWQTPHPTEPGKWIDHKVPHVVDDNVKLARLSEIWEENRRAPTLVFYQFEEELTQLKAKFPGLWTIDMPGAVDTWNRGEIPLLALHPKSAGHGLNLQHGGHFIVWLSLPWSLELYEQANGRLHRSGQKHPVWVYILMSMGTLDERILGALRDKKTIDEFAREELAR